jgi:hypothetical protein
MSFSTTSLAHPTALERRRRGGSRRRRRPGQGNASPAAESPSLPTVAQVVAVDNLLDVFEIVRREGGQAPGIDRVRPRDLSRREAADALRVVADLVLAGTYRPCPTRAVTIPSATAARARCASARCSTGSWRPRCIAP